MRFAFHVKVGEARARLPGATAAKEALSQRNIRASRS